MYKQSLEDPDEFWGSSARSTLKWFRDFNRVSQGGFEHGDVAWFTGGQLNACYNCVDQHLPHRAKQVRCIPGSFCRVLVCPGCGGVIACFCWGCRLHAVHAFVAWLFLVTVCARRTGTRTRLIVLTLCTARNLGTAVVLGISTR